MKMPVWCLVVLLPCVLVRGRSSDCQAQCVACGLILQQQRLQQTFNTMVCFLECEGHVTSSLTWEVCQHAVPQLFRRDGEEVEAAAGGPPLQAAAGRFQEGGPSEWRRLQDDSSLLGSSEGEGLGVPGLDGDGEESEEDGGSRAEALSKRFGGFQRGRHSYRKLIGSSIRPLQKRYGGFIGVRKSARKWNSQKRVNQLLRQYLGMRSSRSRGWRQSQL